MIKFAWILITLMAATLANAQKYLVRLNNKGNTPFTLSNPAAYLSSKALERRSRYTIAIDSTDLPVTPSYIDSIRSVSGVTVLNVSKWLNQVSIQVTNPEALEKINRFPFVQTASRIASHIEKNEKIMEGASILSHPSKKFKLKTNQRKVAHTSDNVLDYGNSFSQVHIHNGEFLHNIGLRGQHMIVGILDAGFRNFTSLKAFDSVIANGQILGTWDFVANNETVTDDDAHGMQVFSVIAANIPGTFIGTASKAGYYLFRSENVASEYPIEEHDWVCAAERVDSLGGDIITSSLGYTKFQDAQFNHTYAQMDGNTTMAAIGADLAAKKGILVGNAVGNDGNSSWKFLSTPADGDSVLAVGSVNSNGQPSATSSFGPSADGQVKPDVASMGVNTTIQLTNNKIGTSSGTSFACPNLMGLATCLWQGFPEKNNMAIINALRQSASMSSNPDNKIGYGIPDVKIAVSLLLKQTALVQTSLMNCKALIQWTSKDMNAMKYVVERKRANDTGFIKLTEIKGSGNVFSTHSYQWTDDLKNTEAGQVQYRIQQVLDTSDITFSALYLDTLAVIIVPSCALTDKFTVMPNPNRGEFVLQAAFEESVNNLQLIIFNAAGQRVFSQKQSKPTGIINYNLAITHLASGKYYLKIYNDNTLLATKEFIRL